MTEQITYNKEADILTVRVDELPDDMMDIVTSQPFELILDMVYNKYTGALLEFELTGLLSTFRDDAPDGLVYDPECDTLYIHLHPDDNGKRLCDLAYCDEVEGILVCLNRSSVGNLTGIEVVGLEKILETTIDISENQGS